MLEDTVKMPKGEINLAEQCNNNCSLAILGTFPHQ